MNVNIQFKITNIQFKSTNIQFMIPFSNETNIFKVLALLLSNQRSKYNAIYILHDFIVLYLIYKEIKVPDLSIVTGILLASLCTLVCWKDDQGTTLTRGSVMIAIVANGKTILISREVVHDMLAYIYQYLVN